MSGNALVKRIQVAASAAGARVLRNNVAVAWVGQLFKPDGIRVVTMVPGDVLLRGARPLHAGLHVGSGDLIGWKTITITPDMVGRPVAVFTSIEAKDGSGRPSRAQLAWQRAVRMSGGIALISHSEEEVVNDLNSFK